MKKQWAATHRCDTNQEWKPVRYGKPDDRLSLYPYKNIRSHNRMYIGNICSCMRSSMERGEKDHGKV